jgi:hypothetical protein
MMIPQRMTMRALSKMNRDFHLLPRGLKLVERGFFQFSRLLPEHWAMLGGNYLAQ